MKTPGVFSLLFYRSLDWFDWFVVLVMGLTTVVLYKTHPGKCWMLGVFAIAAVIVSCAQRYNLQESMATLDMAVKELQSSVELNKKLMGKLEGSAP